MEFMGKELKDLVVTLPYADGTEVDCSVYASYETDGKQYFALKPLLEDGTPDPEQGYMIYRVEEDEEKNPVIIYIEDDLEYALAARYFAEHYLGN